MKNIETKSDVAAIPELKKVIVAQSLFIAEALKRKVPAFAEAEVITEYAGIRNKIIGCEVLGTQMDVSLAQVAKVFHQCTLPVKRDTIDVYEKMDATNGNDMGLTVTVAEMWSPMTYTVESLSYAKWAVEAMATPTEPLVLEG
jgi:hypothetical protein